MTVWSKLGYYGNGEVCVTLNRREFEKVLPLHLLGSGDRSADAA
jgi:hypothetical protein